MMGQNTHLQGLMLSLASIIAILIATLVTHQSLVYLVVGALIVLLTTVYLYSYHQMRKEDILYVTGYLAPQKRNFFVEKTRIDDGFLLFTLFLSIVGILLWFFGSVFWEINSKGHKATFFTINSLKSGGVVAVDGLVRSINPADGLVRVLTYRPAHGIKFQVDIFGVGVLVMRLVVAFIVGSWIIRNLQIKAMIRDAISTLPSAPKTTTEKIERLAKVAPNATFKNLIKAYEYDLHIDALIIIYVEAIGRLRMEVSQKFLVALMQDQERSPAVQEAIIRALRFYEDSEICGLIRNALNNTIHLNVREACIQTLGALKDSVSSHKLQMMIRDPNTKITLRDKATVAFHQINYEYSYEMEKRFIDDLRECGRFEDLSVNQFGFQRFRRIKDDAYCIVIPFGPFRRGSNLSEAERPEREIFFPTFLIDEYPVTVKQFKEFSEKVDINKIYENTFGRKFKKDKKAYSEVFANNRINDLNFPMTSISWRLAVMYSRWALDIKDKFDENALQSIGLPLESQWEKASRGVDGRTYPWGNDALTPDFASYLNKRGMHSIHDCPKNISPYGVKVMAGNVWEWCADYMHIDAWKHEELLFGLMNEGEHRSIRGGSWDGYDFYCRSNYRLYARNYPSNERIGLRCAWINQEVATLLENNLIPPAKVESVEVETMIMEEV